MLPCISFNCLHHVFIYETERSAWPSYGEKSEIDNISVPKNDKWSNYYVDVISDPTWGRFMYLQPCIDTELEQIHLTYSAHIFFNCGQLQ